MQVDETERDGGRERKKKDREGLLVEAMHKYKSALCIRVTRKGGFLWLKALFTLTSKDKYVTVSTGPEYNGQPESKKNGFRCL